MTYFRINRPHIVHETLDDEVIIVNLDSGTYYSLDSASLWAWQTIQAGYSLAEMVEFGKSKFDTTAEEIRKALNVFLDKLKTEGIIVPADSPLKATDAPPPAGHSPKIPFTAPALELYTDMQDLLLLDPIHDVDDSGWPNVKEQPL